MEIPRIHQQAQQHFNEARYATETRQRVAWEEIPNLRKERRIRQQAVLAMTVVATLNPSRKFIYNRRTDQELNAERQIRERLRQKVKQARRLERRLRAATTRAQILTELMRRARGGDPYAMHQADLMSQPQVSVSLV